MIFDPTDTSSPFDEWYSDTFGETGALDYEMEEDCDECTEDRYDDYEIDEI